MITATAGEVSRKRGCLLELDALEAIEDCATDGIRHLALVIGESLRGELAVLHEQPRSERKQQRTWEYDREDEQEELSPRKAN